MRPARPGVPVPALLLLALVLAPRGTQGRPGGSRGAHVAGEEPKPSLPVASRSAGRSPGGRHGNPLQCSCLENLMDRGAWRVTGMHAQLTGFISLKSKGLSRVFSNTTVRWSGIPIS
ncbi:hypothetical protein FD755_016786 [Muntiacus reevesi]|uniref:Uncharacterized protein n=1 Tax=Muntiacus reevesi TaxID=9886 RepID=A0A5N3XCX0_MUNRE|nr:hypothetical protein FD755_016786 [Muntiacus reevesi]